MFVSSETRSRHAKSDHLISIVDSALSDSALQAAVDDAEKYKALLDDLVVPNFKHGVVSLGRAAMRNPNAVPLIIQVAGEDLVGQGVFNAQTQTQVEHLKKRLRSWKFTSDAQDTFLNTIHAQLIQRKFMLPGSTARATTRASVSAGSVESAPTMYNAIWREPAALRAFGRPIVRTLLPSLGPNLWHNASGGLNLLHELVHVRQVIELPIYNENKVDARKLSLERELEAYHIGYLASHSLYEHSENPYFAKNDKVIDAITDNVEKVRREENAKKKNPFEPAKRIDAILSDVGMDIGV